MKKIKICHFVSGLKAGGAESVIYNYTRLMDKEKFEFSIVYQHEPAKKDVDMFSTLNYNFKQVPHKNKNPFGNLKATYDYLKENKFDIVHCHMTLANFFPLICASILKVPCRINHSHSSDNRKKNIFSKGIEWFLKKINISFSNVNLSCGEEAGKYMFGSKDFIILNNALDLEKYKYNEKKRNDIRKKYKVKDDEILIGHIGRFTLQKNHDFVLEIFNEYVKNNKKAKLILLGDGELKSDIETKVEELGLEKKIIFTGIVSNTQDYYSAFDIFILPSFWEGLPVVGIEAQASGVQCMFSNNIDDNVVVDNNKTTLLQLELVDWVNKLSEIKSHGKRNIAISKFNNSGFNIEKEYKKLEKIYKVH